MSPSEVNVSNRIKVPATLHYARAVEIVKKARAQAKYASKMWCEAENKNAPLWTENARLRDLVASHERSIRSAHQVNARLQARLDAISENIAAIDAG